MEPQPDGTVQVGDIDPRWRIEPETFQRNFTPTKPPVLTHLLYEIFWIRSCNTWKNWCTSTGLQHAENNFLENHCRVINRRTDPCSITWFLSWSPCGRCSRSIIDFLNNHANVTLNIKVCQLHKDYIRWNRNGLRDLANHGVQISIMQQPDYDYYWRTFVSHQPRGRNDWPWNFSCWIQYYSQQLHSILTTTE
ncbi:C-_U-editing enzyme APOBEC-1-like [Sphaerodactylus townsendi]|uniref:Uncharacterized protein n=1 Tax=Sphaerodactylus townsendi TaxID=933632 RepID=A0ACB8E8E5_9SAUR|nr:C->U-editing enzyme APOBEC-1-like [Sphaerodactylus townsendi]